MSDESVFECARVIRAELPLLMSPQTAARRDSLDQHLARILAHSEKPGAAQEILDVLRSEPELRTWAAAFLAAGIPPRYVERAGYQRLAGSGEAVPASRFACPDGDFAWYRAFLDEPVPQCPTHRCPLVQQDQSSC
jgi:hypothetical protein